jgi:Ca2+/Na+ antiporter
MARIPIEGHTLAGLLLMGAAALHYAAGRSAVFALARPDGSDPGRRAFGQWLPIAATVIAAVILKHPEIAVSVIFGTSVACLSLVLGLATYLAPLQNLPGSRRVWPFVLPAALLPFMAGFSGHLSWWHAVMMLALGGAVLAVWLQTPDEPTTPHEDRPDPGVVSIAVIGAVILAAVGSWVSVSGVIMSSQYTQVLTSGTLAATILSPLLVLPTLGTASLVAQRGYAGQALSALIGTVLLNLCALLPVTVILWYLTSMHGPDQTAAAANLHGIHNPFSGLRGLPYAMATWRIETVMLVVLGFALTPVAMGRWALGRLESVLLVLGYAMYLAVVAVFGGRFV